MFWIWNRALLRFSPPAISAVAFLLLIESCDCSSLTGTECTLENHICALPTDNSLRFFILGDWGGQDHYPYTTRLQEETAAAVNNASERMRPQFYLSTGDNFYERGVKSTKDKRFNATFENVYTYGKDEKVPWYIVAGNHDYYGSIEAQMDYSRTNPRWIYPSLYYPIRYSFGKPHRAGITTVDIFIIDTILLCGGTVLGGWNSKTGVYVKPSDRPTGPKSITAANESFSWLENALRKSMANFVFVVGHYPVYSTGVHGETECLRDRLADTLMKYNVNAYVAGHDHQLQHLTMVGRDGWTVHHIVSGAGSRYDRRYIPRTAANPQSLHVVTSMYAFPSSKESQTTGGYVYGEILGRIAVFEYYRSDGTLLYSFRTSRRRKGT